MSGSVNPLRAGIYGRESKGKVKSVEDQVSTGRGVIAENGWAHVASYDDGSSASRFAVKARDDWQKLMVDLAEDKLDVLIVWEITRGSREPVDGFTWLNLCRDHGVLIYVISDEELYDPRKTRHFDSLGRALLDGVKESNTTSDRVLRGVRRSAAQGRPAGGRTLRGYRRERRVEKGDDGKLVTVVSQVPDEAAPDVRDLFARVAKHDALVAISRDTGLHRHTIRKMVQNPAYKGVRINNGSQYPAQWPGIISDKVWADANAVLDQPGRKLAKPGAKRWLLTYLATGECGGPIHTQTVRESRKFPVYRCLADACAMLGQPEADEFITRLVVERLSRPDAVDLFLANDDAAAQAAEEAKQLRADLEAARDSFGGEDGISAASLASIERRLEPRIVDAERRRVAASVPSVVADVVTSGTPRRTFDQLPLVGKRTVISTLFESVVFTRPSGKSPITRWSTFDDRLDHAAERVKIEWR